MAQTTATGYNAAWKGGGEHLVHHTPTHHKRCLDICIVTTFGIKRLKKIKGTKGQRRKEEGVCV